LESLCTPWMRQLAMFAFIVVEKSVCRSREG